MASTSAENNIDLLEDDDFFSLDQIIDALKELFADEENVRKNEERVSENRTLTDNEKEILHSMKRKKYF